MTKQLILSIDGGGIRGIIPLYAIQALEEQRQQPARESFSFIAGTSTGAIIAAGLSVGMPAAEILTLYTKQADQIFQSTGLTHVFDRLASFFYRLSGKRSGFLSNAAHFLAILFDLLSRARGYKYRTEPMFRLLQQRIRQATGRADDIRVNELPVDILITAKAVKTGKPRYFVKDYPENNRTTGHLTLADCATASAAAPGYFEPWTIQGYLDSKGEPIGPLVDGGVGTAGNPVYQLCVEAFDYSPLEKYVEPETIIVSLGTGRQREKERRPVPTNILDWLQWILGTLLESPAVQQLELVERNFPQAITYRIDIELPEDIDMADVHAIPTLVQCGQKLARLLSEPDNDWASILAGRPNSWVPERGQSTLA